VYLPDQKPFPTEDPGDVSYRIIPVETETATLRGACAPNRVSDRHRMVLPAMEAPDSLFQRTSRQRVTVFLKDVGVSRLHFTPERSF
jgi:hypothetical protein